MWRLAVLILILVLLELSFLTPFESVIAHSGHSDDPRDPDLVYLEIRANLEETDIIGHGTPAVVTIPVGVRTGVFKGYLLPIWTDPVNINEELYFSVCVPERWDKENDIYIEVVSALTDPGEGNNAYRLHIETESASPMHEAVPNGFMSVDVQRDSPLSNVQYFCYRDWFEIPCAPLSILTDDIVAWRLQRIGALAPASGNLTGDLIILHIGVSFPRGDLLAEEEGMTEAIFFFGFVLLAIGLMGGCYAFKKPVLGFGAAGGWLLLGFYSYGYLTDLGIIYWGVRGALFFICMGLVFVSIFEAMGARGKKEIGDDWEVDDKSEEEVEVDDMIKESEAQQRPGKKLRDYFSRNKKSKKKGKASIRKIARQEAKRAVERGD